MAGEQEADVRSHKHELLSLYLSIFPYPGKSPSSENKVKSRKTDGE